MPAGDVVKVVPKADAVKRNLQVRTSSDPSQIPKNDSIVTQIIRLSYANAAEISQVIQPLLGTGSQITTYPITKLISANPSTSSRSGLPGKELCYKAVSHKLASVRGLWRLVSAKRFAVAERPSRSQISSA